ncbi:hypothetical protein BG004_006589, partial [Podila humilis]
AGTKLMETMIASIVQATKKEANGADNLDRNVLLAQIEKVRDQFQGAIDANPWLKEQLDTGYWS